MVCFFPDRTLNSHMWKQAEDSEGGAQIGESPQEMFIYLFINLKEASRSQEYDLFVRCSFLVREFIL